MKRHTGDYLKTTVAGEVIAAFVPAALPPAEPSLALEGALGEMLRLAEEALARLESVGKVTPGVDGVQAGLVRKEAVLTSQIEGVRASLEDLLVYEAAGSATPNPDVEEVANYLRALTFARKELAEAEGLPLSLRLLNESHRLLMAGERGAKKYPGEVRRSQNWIGGSRPGNARFVPPPPQVLSDLLTSLERWLHGADPLPPLVRVGLAHVQFETIHPYLDGNGRVGRLLIALLLEHWGLLSKPLLYLSLFFKRHQMEYYLRLGAVRVEGDWEGWLDYFLDGVATIANEAVEAVRALSAQVAADRVRILAAEGNSGEAAGLFELLPGRPMVTEGLAAGLMGTSKAVGLRAVETLVKAGILVEAPIGREDRVFVYRAYVDNLRVGTEL